MRKIFFPALAAVLPLMSSASTTWTLQGKEYQVDTLYHATVGPGTTHTSLKLTGPQKLRVTYTTTDLTNPNIEMQTVQAGNLLKGGATLSGMVSKYQKSDCRYVAGVNADFFGNSQPIGTSVVNGEYYYAVNNGWSHWAIDRNRVPKVADMGFRGSVTTAAGTSHALSGVNSSREENNLVIYNARKGANSGTNAYGSEVPVKPVSAPLSPGSTVELEVIGNPATDGSMAIPSGGYVLSGHGTGKDFVSALKPGDRLSVATAIVANGTEITATQVAGGRPLILSGGEVLNTQGALDHLTALNPRTAIGYNADATKLVLLVVDGRSSISQGCVSRVLADIMAATGCTEAMNFDGGGSSTLYVDNLGVCNTPSDGTERAVVNAVFAVSPTPDDAEIASFEFEDHAIVLPRYGIYRPKFHFFNKYGVWRQDKNLDVQLSCDPALGEITADGALLASGEGCHALTARVGDMVATIPVTVGSASPQFKRDRVLLDGFYEYSVEVESLVGETMMSVANQALTWSSDNPEVATVDADGRIKGVADGSAVIRGTVGDVTDELTVEVAVPSEHYVTVDPMNSRDDWTVTSSNLKDLTMTPDDAGKGMTVSFSVSSSRSPSLTFARDITLWSRPSALEIEVNPGDGAYSTLNVTYSCDGARNAIAKLPLSLTPNENNVVKLEWDKFFTLDTPEAYPLTIKRIQFAVGGAAGSSYSTHLGELKAYYPQVRTAPAGVVVPGGDDNGVIDFSQPVELYDMRGMKVSQPKAGTLYIVKQGPNVAKIIF